MRTALSTSLLFVALFSISACSDDSNTCPVNAYLAADGECRCIDGYRATLNSGECVPDQSGAPDARDAGSSPDIGSHNDTGTDAHDASGTDVLADVGTDADDSSLPDAANDTGTDATLDAGDATPRDVGGDAADASPVEDWSTTPARCEDYMCAFDECVRTCEHEQACGLPASECVADCNEWTVWTSRADTLECDAAHGTWQACRAALTCSELSRYWDEELPEDRCVDAYWTMEDACVELVVDVYIEAVIVGPGEESGAAWDGTGRVPSSLVAELARRYEPPYEDLVAWIEGGAFDGVAAPDLRPHVLRYDGAEWFEEGFGIERSNTFVGRWDTLHAAQVLEGEDIAVRVVEVDALIDDEIATLGIRWSSIEAARNAGGTVWLPYAEGTGYEVLLLGISVRDWADE